MSLGRLLLAWVPVALWFVVLGWALHRAMGNAASPPLTFGAFAWAAAEALVVTLFASLWFDSLGHGAWWVLFGIVGLVAAALHTRPPSLSIVISVIRYLVAGALLAWSLG